MNTETRSLQGDERAALQLRALYSAYGYTQYKMSKFEEYELYVRNKDFLVSDHVITFTDTAGKLMALKPDVTLSIIKNTDGKNGVEKVYYQENVYRVSAKTGSFREIMQVGLECIGRVDAYCLYEVLTLAAKSLAAISDNAILDVSHMGIISAVLDALSVDKGTRRALLSCIGEKNTHELKSIAGEAGAAPEVIAVLEALVTGSGKPAEVLPSLLPLLTPLVPAQMLESFAALMTALAASPVGELIRIDFSVVSDLGYYNGIVFKGFVDGVPESLLNGGEYAGLMRKMGREEDAIGFAVYLDALERLLDNTSPFDVDTLILYRESASPAALMAAVERVLGEGKTVLTLQQVPPTLRYRTKLYFDEREGTLREAND